ncbi:hypothetical protein MPTA5024_11215 [Microbispora sp. ATCC PTA-5024]|nr:hypothetical protein MPTA5024_11215 [Microbispora sp. ATCC PTA-5024]
MLLWGAALVAATYEFGIRFYLLIWLATGLSSLWTLAAWAMKADHSVLAQARLRIAEARLNGALHEEAEMRAMELRAQRHLNSVV